MPVPAEPNDLTNAIAKLINANERMRVNLEANAVVLKQALMRLKEGTELGDALHLLPSADQRAMAMHTLANLVDSREELSVTLVNVALDSGMSLDVLAERLGLSPDEVAATVGIARPDVH